jgi:hypothetical protein
MARAAALTATAGLVVVLSLNWFAFEPPPTTQQPGEDGGGILNLLHVYSLKDFHASGWAGLGWLTVALIGLAAGGIVAELRTAAVIVAGAALVALALDLAAEDDGIGLRWPAYVGVALTAALLACAVWSWRARVGQDA